MYRVISNAPYGYTGCSRKLAFQMTRALRKAGASFLMSVRRDGNRRVIAEHVA